MGDAVNKLVTIVVFFLLMPLHQYSSNWKLPQVNVKSFPQYVRFALNWKGLVAPS